MTTKLRDVAYDIGTVLWMFPVLVLHLIITAICHKSEPKDD